MTDREFVLRTLELTETWGDWQGFPCKDESDSSDARFCAEWLAEQLLKRKCLISRHYSDNRITLGDCSLEFSNTDYRTALLEAAKALIAKEE